MMATLALRNSAAVTANRKVSGRHVNVFRVMATAAREASPAPTPSSVHHESREELRKHGAVVHEELYPRGMRKPSAGASAAPPPPPASPAAAAPPPPPAAGSGSTHHETREELRSHGAVVHEEVSPHPHATGSHLPGNNAQEQAQAHAASHHHHHERHVSPGPQVREPVMGPDSTGAASWVRRSRDEGQQEGQRAQSPLRE